MESYFSAKKYLSVYFLTGIFGNLLGSYLYQDRVYTGASHSTFGIFGMNCVYIKDHYDYMGKERSSNFKHYIWVILATFSLFYLDDVYIEAFSLPLSFALGIILTYALHKPIRCYTKYLLCLLLVGFTVIMVLRINTIELEEMP